MIALLSAMVIRGLIVGRFEGPWLVIGPLAGLGLSVLLGLNVASIGREGIAFRREENGGDGRP